MPAVSILRKKFFGKPQLPAAQPDVDVGKQGDAADIPDPAEAASR